MTTTTPSLDIRRSGDRFSSQLPWLDSKHSFSFSDHWDSTNTHHGVLRVLNDDIIEAGTGFDFHPHRDMEIVTWVLEGSLVHQDSEGNNGIIYPGLAQRMSAGNGIMHSEKNDSWKIDGTWNPHDTPVRLLQMWVVPDEAGIKPGYEQLEIDPERLNGSLVPVISGMSKHADVTAIRIHNKYAAMHVARLQPGQSVDLPEAPFLHLFVARGAVSLEGAGDLMTGDDVRLTATGGQRVTATAPAEIVIWEMHATIASR